MTLTVRLPPQVEQKLAKYCAEKGVSKSDAVKKALEDLLTRSPADRESAQHPFVGGQRGGRADLSANVKALLRARFRGKHR